MALPGSVPPPGPPWTKSTGFPLGFPYMLYAMVWMLLTLSFPFLYGWMGGKRAVWANGSTSLLPFISASQSAVWDCDARATTPPSASA